MPPYVYTIFIHGADIIESFDIPIGWLSEECLEANHKIFRRIRLYNSRMCSQEATNEDIIHCLLILSDPVMFSLRIHTERHKIAQMKHENSSTQ